MRKSNKVIAITVGSIIVAITLGLFLLDVFKVSLLQNPKADTMLKGILMRGVASVGVILLTLYCGYRYLGFSKITLRSIAVIAPFFLVAINNFPFVDFFSGKTEIVSVELIWLFALECLFVGIFEELMFRGVVFSFCLEKWSETKRDRFIAVIVSSAVFGLFHLVNLFSGSSFPAVAMQVGYSFLMGAMLSIILLKTKCIWLCAITHAVYNFGGLIFTSLGTGNVWGLATVILTVTVAVCVGLYAIFLLVKTEDSGIAQLINRKSEIKTEEGRESNNV